MSRRINSDADQLNLVTLIDRFSADLNPNTKADAIKNIEINREWLDGTNHLNLAVHLDSYFKADAAFENQMRLPKVAAPKYYKLHLDARNIPSGALPFTGEVEIDVQIVEATDFVMFHSKNQVINELKVFANDRVTEIPIMEYHLYPAADTLTIYFLESLNANTNIVVKIKYSTNLVVGSTGFYQTSYNEGGVRYLGATQFESTGGRYAFPHFDEPGFKAVFELTITHSASHNAIANTLGNETDK